MVVKLVGNKIKDSLLIGQIVEYSSFKFVQEGSTHVNQVTMEHGKMRVQPRIDLAPFVNAVYRSFDLSSE